jgi:hypothetical protein
MSWLTRWYFGFCCFRLKSKHHRFPLIYIFKKLKFGGPYWTAIKKCPLKLIPASKEKLSTDQVLHWYRYLMCRLTLRSKRSVQYDIVKRWEVWLWVPEDLPKDGIVWLLSYWGLPAGVKGGKVPLQHLKPSNLLIDYAPVGKIFNQK